MDPIKAVIFDLDNTILDRTSTFKAFTNHFLQTYFKEHRSTQEMFERIIALDQDGYKDKTELFSELIDELPWNTKPSLADLLEYYKNQYVKCAVFMEHAQEVVLQLRKKYKIGLITNGRTAIQYGKIDQLGIRDYFDVIVVSEEAGLKKPDPGIFQIALNKLQLKAAECIFVGDHPVNDIQGAAKIGMQTIWMKVNQPWNEEAAAKPLYSITKLSDLLKFI